MLEALSQVQATPEELKKLTSIASVQTKGLKRYFLEEERENKPKTENNVSEGKLDSLKGSKRKIVVQERASYDKIDPNIVGFESSSDSESESDEKKQKIDVEVKQEKIETNCVAVVADDNKEVSVVETTENRMNGVTKEEINKTVKKVIVERKPALFVEVNRSEEIQIARLKLPILAEEQQIMETINENSIVIIAGETGSGKTTQVPQFLYEAGYALKKQIGVTEPRRVAAISMSKRVAEEMNLSCKEVSYLIRFEGNVTEDTKIKFMTDGVLLKEVQSDFLLQKYSVIVLDEAHERSVYTDILIGLLSRIVPLRHKKNDPLKLIVMSATLRLEDFTENRRLFKVAPPVIKVETRQFPVTVHFNKRTNDNYLKEAFRKVVKIHTKLPEGGILVFVTGQREVNHLVRKLSKAFPLKHKITVSEADALKTAIKQKKKLKLIPKIDLDDYSVPGDKDSATESEDTDDSDSDVPAPSTAQPLWTLPLFSLLPSHKQAKVFTAPPLGCRLCIVSTNVAETSLTLPNVKYVVDCGKTKVKLYDKVTGVSSFVVAWTSKASADQRAGRAGRLGPGHCYRLYSSAVYNDEFAKYSVPEIQRKPVDDLYLQMKCMNINKVVNFPFPTAPDMLQLKSAEERLTILGALSEGKVTALGRVIAKFPVAPRFAKMLALSHQYDLLPYTICLVAALSVQEVLLETPIGAGDPEARQKWAAIRRSWAGIGNSLLLGDNMVLLRAVGAAEYANSEGKLEQFCTDNGLRKKAIEEIRKLRLQLTNEIQVNVPDVEVVVDPKLAPPNDVQAKLLRQLLLSGMGDCVAKKIMPDELKEGEDKAKFKYAYCTHNMEEPVFLHHTSVLKKTLPEYVVYQEIYETNKMYMRGVTAIEPEWLLTYVPALSRISEPLLQPEPSYDSRTGKIYCTVTATFGPQAWSIPQTRIEFPKTPTAYKWFARFFLEGEVCERLRRYAKQLLSAPGTMLKSWARLQPRTEAMLRALASRDIRTRETLVEVWEEEPKCELFRSFVFGVK